MVGSIQELTKNQQETIPERYIRTYKGKPIPMTISDYQLNIPIIDMGKFSEGMHREQEIKKLAHACEEWGFF